MWTSFIIPVYPISVFLADSERTIVSPFYSFCAGNLEIQADVFLRRLYLETFLSLGKVLEMTLWDDNIIRFLDRGPSVLWILIHRVNVHILGQPSEVSKHLSR